MDCKRCKQSCIKRGGYYCARYEVYPERRIGDPEISVWLSVDAMATNAHNLPLTPYHFCANNPINFVDPDGNDWFFNEKTGEAVHMPKITRQEEFDAAVTNFDKSGFKLFYF